MIWPWRYSKMMLDGFVSDARDVVIAVNSDGLVNVNFIPDGDLDASQGERDLLERASRVITVRSPSAIRHSELPDMYKVFDNVTRVAMLIPSVELDLAQGGGSANIDVPGYIARLYPVISRSEDRAPPRGVPEFPRRSPAQ
jgi:hypothetical protein